MNAVEEAERRAVEALGNKIGFGRVMQLCAEIWRKRDPIGALTVGPCIGTKDRIDRVDASLAAQLQRSIEKNGRMIRRLQKFTGYRGRHFAEIEAILNDQEPSWPEA